MKRKSGIVFLIASLVASVAASLPAIAADPGVQLKTSAPLAPDIAAFPRLVAAPQDQAAQRINQALDHRDKQVQSAAKDCRANNDSPKDAEWTRVIAVTMQGPRYLSLVATDSWSCGAHPDSSDMALVYDLHTGSPLNWARLLPASMVQGTSTDTVGDDTTIGLLSSHVLQDLYVMAASADTANPLDPDCKDVVSDPDLKLAIWPDAKGDGLAVEPAELPSAVRACGDSFVLTTATLRKLGVQPALLDAIDTAHAQGLYDQSKP